MITLWAFFGQLRFICFIVFQFLCVSSIICDVVGMSINPGSEGMSATSDPEARDTFESGKRKQKHFLTLCKFKLCLNRCPGHNLNDITYIENFNK